jgi:hypothetical protein
MSYSSKVKMSYPKMEGIADEQDTDNDRQGNIQDESGTDGG